MKHLRRLMMLVVLCVPVDQCNTTCDPFQNWTDKITPISR